MTGRSTSRTGSAARGLASLRSSLAAEASASGPWAVLAARRERTQAELDASATSRAAQAAHAQHMRELRHRVRAESAQALRLARKTLGAAA